MVMIFRSEKALKHLLEKRFVFTFRHYNGHDRKLGTEWVTDRRGGNKICDVIVCIAHGDKLLSPNPLQLIPYVFGSGFDSVDEWIEEIKRLNKPDPDFGIVGEVFCVIKRR